MVTIPVMAAAYLGLRSDQVPHASIATRITSQLGGAFGAAVIAMILQTQIAAHAAGGLVGLATAFDHAFWWSLGLTALAIIPALFLPGSPKAAARRPNEAVLIPDHYYSCPLDWPHLWAALRYTELNPVRAGIVQTPAAYPWSMSPRTSTAATPMAHWTCRHGVWPGLRPHGASIWKSVVPEEAGAIRRCTHTGLAEMAHRELQRRVCVDHARGNVRAAVFQALLEWSARVSWTGCGSV